METKTNLNKETTGALQELVEINIDSAKGFLEAADSIDHGDLDTLFRRISTQRRKNAAELQDYLRVNGAEADSDGSALGTAHRKWLDLRAAINSGKPEVVLIEAERGEDAIKEKYEDLIEETAGSAMSDVLHRQYAMVKEQHDGVRNLRDLAKAN